MKTLLLILLLAACTPKEVQVAGDYAVLVKIEETKRWINSEWVTRYWLTYELSNGERRYQMVSVVDEKLYQRIKILR